MQIFPLKTLFLLIGIVCISACVNPQNGNSAAEESGNTANTGSVAGENANVVKDDVLELESIINSPFVPDDSSVWRETAPNPQNDEKPLDPNHRKLIAVLRFSPEQSAEIVRRAESHRAAVPAVLDVESWYPPELIAQSGHSGDKTIKGNSYAANDFVKAPFTDGKLTRIENTEFFILELTTP